MQIDIQTRSFVMTEAIRSHSTPPLPFPLSRYPHPPPRLLVRLSHPHAPPGDPIRVRLASGEVTVGKVGQRV